jgi:transcriptional regulator with XRE-family HTH domain
MDWSRLEFDMPDRMRRALRISGVSAGDMAEYLGVRREAVSTWLSGRINPRKSTLRLWALRTGVPLEWLETGQVPDDGPAPDGAPLPRLDSNQQPSGYPFALVRPAA